MPSDDPIEAEVMEEAGTELVPASPAPATLFRTDDPVEIVNKASQVATVLTNVLKQRNLTSRIGDKDYVQVEGWTLCGTMLGVFAVIEWSRPINEGPEREGWEARATAQNLAGQIVGAAEAECLYSERNWKNRDDYALRSMAQTRAVSKALRAPLGFIVQMAGFAATPAEEMPRDDEAPEPARSARAQQAGYPVPKSWPKILAAFTDCDNDVESQALYEAFLRAATYHVYGKTSLKEISTEERAVMAQKAAGAAVFLHDTDAGREGPFQYFGEAEHRAAWAHVLDGTMLEIPDYVPPEPPLSDKAQEEIDQLAAETLADPS